MSLPDHLGASHSPIGLLLLTGGEGRRLGAPKHCQIHPEGGTWAGHLVRVFEQVFPHGPVQVVGDPIPDRLELGNLEDLRQGPARALSVWAATNPPSASRWWVLACDQVRWAPSLLAAWYDLALLSDPEAQTWVLAEHDARLQFLGGFLGATLLPAVACSSAGSMKELTRTLPIKILKATGSEWLDVDSPEDLKLWRN